MTFDFKATLARVVNGQSLEEGDAYEALGFVMDGHATPGQIGGILVALRMKGETVAELTGFARAMRERCAPLAPAVAGELTDTCGTGGAAIKTFNVSTLAAFIAAGAGVVIAKHGNRAVSSRSGSADVLEALGANLAVDPSAVERIIERVGIGFLFAPSFHPAMKHAGPARRELGLRTVFNILGPLTNPARAKHQVLGVYDPSLVEKLTPVLHNLGSKEAMVVHGEGGLDEISLFGRTHIGHLRGGAISYSTMVPEDLGFERVQPSDVRGGDAAENAVLITRVLRGEASPYAELALLNAAATILVSGRADTMVEAVLAARASVTQGRARDKLVEFIRATRPEANFQESDLP